MLNMNANVGNIDNNLYSPILHARNMGEMLVVETVIIPKAGILTSEEIRCLESQGYVYHLRENETVNRTKVSAKTSTIGPTVNMPYVPAQSIVPRTVDAGTQTENPNPSRERAQQTETSQNFVAIQCDLNKELEEDALFEPLMNETTQNSLDDDNNKKLNFLDFVKEKYFSHSNGKQECLLCGEVKKNIATLHSHMALHWGPAKLCSYCGIKFQHMKLLRAHKCEMKPKQKPFRSRLIDCPHYNCRVCAISEVELYDHINEHLRKKSYNCPGCHRSFCTAGELRRHVAFRLKCLEMAKKIILPSECHFDSKADRVYRSRVFIVHSKKKRAIVKSSLAQKLQNNKPLRCHICLKHCNNSFQYSKHYRRCLRSLRNRIERKLSTWSK